MMQIYNEHGEPIKAYNKDGKEIPIIHTLQASREWRYEFARAERYRKFCIAEVMIIGLLLMAFIFKGDVWER